MHKPGIYRTLINREGAVTLVYATLQQAVVASSTYFIIAAIREATAGNSDLSLRFALAFVASLIIVFIPNTLSVVWLQKWRFASLAAFIARFIEINSGRTTYAHGRDKSKFESWLTNESGVVYENGLRILYDLYQILMSTVLNILVIAWAIDPRISAWYVAAGALLAIATRVFRARIAATAVEMQDARRDFANTMLTAWENIFVGNRHNLVNWQARFGRSIGRAKDSAAGYDRTRTLVSSFAVTLALGVIAFGNGVFLVEQRSNVAALAALLVTLPRQLQVVQNIFAFFSLYLSWEGVRGQFKELENVMSVSAEEKDLTPYVRLADISVSNGGEAKIFPSLPALTEALVSAPRGRFTLRGKNGAGKSTLLALISERTGDASFFLPSNYVDLAFINGEIVGHSDGNRILRVFEEIESLPDVKYILLDEWDANLDAENIRRIDAAIERLAADRTVLESRHRA